MLGVLAAALILAPGLLRAQVSPPDLSVCIDPNTGQWLDGCDASQSICDPGGFRITLTNFVAANDPTNFSGNAIYTYQICSPAAGICVGDPNVHGGDSCLDNDFCRQHGTAIDSTAYCNRDCAIDDFHGLSHFDVTFPGFGDCLSLDNFVGGTCACVPAGNGCSVASSIVLGDGSCFRSGYPVVKCDNAVLPEGSCIEMTLSIAGEMNMPGLGAAIVVDKESGDCNSSCMQGPSCQPCNPPPGGGECFTRTLGFWGTHPWITNDYDPVTVCKNDLSCSGPDNGESNPSCEAHSCNSIMEGLGSIGGEDNKDAAYISMVKQLTAAKLNLNATAALVPGATCSDWMYQGLSIQKWIEYCESLCGKSQQQISDSGCIEALDAFNNSEDTGFQMTPAPFDRPPVDDHGNVSGADPSGFQDAQRGGYVIGKKAPGPGGANCVKQ